MDEARALFGSFGRAKLSVELSCGDLLEGAAGARHQGSLLALARKLWPRPLLRRIFRNHGLFLLVDATKSA
jgi:hypothetical protein